MKNPFANLFKKKSKDGVADKPAPKPDAGKKKEGFFSKLLKNRFCLLYTSPSPRDLG